MKVYWLIIACLLSKASVGQVILDSERDAFVFSVHTIDDFIERFNGNPNTRAEAIFEEMLEPIHHKNQRAWLSSLFNQEDHSWDLALVESFMDDVLAIKNDKALQFEDSDWFAVVQCTATYGYTSHELSILLQVEYDPVSEGSRWEISSFLPTDFFVETCSSPFPEAKSDNIINPMSHATDFIALIQAFEDKENLSNYFQDIRDRQLSTFAWELYEGNLKLKSIDRIEFHFFQIPGWFFKVQHFQRNRMNAGWLISSLKRIGNRDRLQVIEEELNLENPRR